MAHIRGHRPLTGLCRFCLAGVSALLVVKRFRSFLMCIGVTWNGYTVLYECTIIYLPNPLLTGIYLGCFPLPSINNAEMFLYICIPIFDQLQSFLKNLF